MEKVSSSRERWRRRRASRASPAERAADVERAVGGCAGPAWRQDGRIRWRGQSMLGDEWGGVEGEGGFGEEGGVGAAFEDVVEDAFEEEIGGLYVGTGSSGFWLQGHPCPG